MKAKAKPKRVPVPSKPGFSAGFYASLAAHALGTVLCLGIVYAGVTGRLEKEDEYAATIVVFLAAPTGAIYLCSALTLLRQLFLKHPWVYDGSGFRDTTAGGRLLWLHLVLPVRYIPEEAILFVKRDVVGYNRDGDPVRKRMIHTDPKLVEASRPAKRLAWHGWICREYADLTGEEYRSLLARYPDEGSDDHIEHPERLK